MPDDTTPLDVLIIGAGPTGLTLACELARRDVRFRIVDRDAALPTTSRALGTQPRTREVFDLMGIPPSRQKPSLEAAALNLMDGQTNLARVTFRHRRPGQPYDGIMVMEQSATERMLLDHLATYGGRVEWSTTLTDLAPDGDGETPVVATLLHDGREETLRAHWVVGTDGAHSSVRHLIGVPFEGYAFPQEFVLGDLRLDWDRPENEGFVFLADDGNLFALPLPERGLWRLIAALPPSDAPPPEASTLLFQTFLRDRAKDPTTRVTGAAWLSNFRIHQRLATAYRVGNVFLAGDAAHIHSPVGGQGMNTGIQDAFNLGWKLAVAASGNAAPGLLDTYQEERMPVARGVLKATGAGTRLAFTRNPFVREARNLVLPVVLRSAGAQAFLAEQVSEIGVSYRGRSLAEPEPDERGLRGWLTSRKPGGLRPGDRAPEAHAQALPANSPVSLFDLYASGRFTLLLFAGDHPAPGRVDLLQRIVDAIEGRRDTLGRPAVVVRDPDHVGEGHGRVLLDRSGEMHALYEADAGGGWLVRPDGYLACRVDPEHAEADLKAYMTRIVTPAALS